MSKKKTKSPAPKRAAKSKKVVKPYDKIKKPYIKDCAVRIPMNIPKVVNKTFSDATESLLASICKNPVSESGFDAHNPKSEPYLSSAGATVNLDGYMTKLETGEKVVFKDPPVKFERKSVCISQSQQGKWDFVKRTFRELQFILVAKWVIFKVRFLGKK